MYVSEEDKLKYVRGFKSCTLPIWQYAEKMQIKENELKQWLKEYRNIPAFGAIHIDNKIASEVVTEVVTKEEQNNKASNVTEAPAPIDKVATARTILSFENETIKIEIKQNYNKELLASLIGVVAQC